MIKRINLGANKNEENSTLKETEIKRTTEDRTIKVTKMADIPSHKRPGAPDLLSLISSENYYFFIDQDKKSYTRFFNGQCFEILPIMSQDFKYFIKKVVLDSFGRPVKDHTLKEVLDVLCGRAVFDGAKHCLQYRCARNGEDIWIDLGTTKHEAIVVNTNGWAVVDSLKVPIVFKRLDHMKCLPLPKKGCNIEDLRKFIHIEDENIWILLKVWLVTALVPDIGRPCLVFHGLQGAGKSLAARLLRMLIDPSRLDLLPTPSNHDGFIQQINNNYLIALDNLGDLKPWMSDDLCRAITGGAFGKRKLYSDSEDIIYNFQRLFIINGINNPAAAADLLDRSILIELDRIDSKDRKSESDILKEFESLAPGLLGNILDILSKTIAVKDSFTLPELPRMADWATFGYAAAEIMGIGGGRFLKAYQQNIKMQHAEISENDIVASTVLMLIEAEGQVVGTPTQVFCRCKELLPEEVLRTRNWPKTSATFTKRLRLITNNLRELGIIVEFVKGRERLISISKTN